MMMKSLRVTTVLAFIAAMIGVLAPASLVRAQETRVDPPVGAPGTTFDFFASGFEDEERVSFWVDPVTEGQDIIGEPGFSVDAEDDGEAYWSWRALTTTPPGDYLMVAQGNDSNITVTIPFAIRVDPAGESEAAPPPPDAEARVSPTSGPPGTQFNFAADGFEDGERIGYWLNTPTGILADPGFFFDAEDDGDARWNWRAPSGVTPGVYEMVARGNESQVEHVIPFTIE